MAVHHIHHHVHHHGAKRVHVTHHHRGGSTHAKRVAAGRKGARARWGK